MCQCKIIVFTDLDGCLLDHHNYSFNQAIPLIKRLNKLGIPLIINSSKTRTEVEALQEKLGINSPFIIENGAAIIFNPETGDTLFRINDNELQTINKHRIKKLAKPRAELLSIANRIKETHQFKYKGFNDMSLSQISELTQLTLNDAHAASQREFSEPLMWQDSQSRLSQFKNLLAEHQIELQQGGRFIHLGGHFDKGDAMNWLLQHWIHNDNHHKAVIALGDSFNDLNMLNQSDYAIVIKNNTTPLNPKGKVQTIHSSLSGTAGWIETLEPLVMQLMNNEGRDYG